MMNYFFRKSIAYVLFPLFITGNHALPGATNWKINRIIFAGNSNLNESVIKNVLLTKESKWFESSCFNEELFADDLDAIIALYHNFGYIKAQILTTHARQDTATKNIDLFIFISEGDQFFISDLIFSGNTKFSDARLAQKMKSRPNQPFNKQQLGKDTYSLLQLYAQSGYIDAKIEPNLNIDYKKKKIAISYQIAEHLPIRIDSIRITGLKKLKAFVIKRNLRFKPGELFNYHLIRLSRRNIERLGLTEKVSIKPAAPDSAGQILRDIIIEIKEKDNGEINFGIGFGTEDLLRGSFEMLQNNFMGRGKQIGIKSRASFIHKGLELSFTDPRFMSPRNRLDINLFAHKNKEPNYKIRQSGGKFTFGHYLACSTSMTLAFKYQDVRLSEIKGIPKIEKSKGNIRSLFIGLVHDTRNNLFNTTKGSYCNVKLQSAGGFLRGSNTFIKLQLDQRAFLSYGKKIVFAGSLKNGIIKNFGNFNNLPLQERFYAGGSGSVRGFKKREVGPKTEDDDPLGGVYMIVSNIELRYSIYRNWGGILFFDAGGIWQKLDQINYKNLRYGYGLGIGYQSPLGVARIDLGLKLNPQLNNSWGEVHFTVGQPF